LGTGGDCARGIVGEAEINDVDFHEGDLRNKAVLGIALKVDDSIVGAILVGITRVTRHDIRVDINGIDGVHDGDAVVVTKNIEDGTAVALGTVRDKDLVIRDIEPPIAVVMRRDCRAQKLVPLLGAVAMEALTRSHLVDGGMHRLADGGGKRFGHVSDTATDHPGRSFGICFGEGLHPTCDFREEVTGLELEVVGIKSRHRARE
jgi:hypothetical protein